MTNKQVKSINRRLKFVAYSRYFFNLLSSAITRLLRISVKHSYQNIPDRLLHILYDLIESAHLGLIVPSFGNVCGIVSDLSPPLEQHPLHRGYYYDSSTHSMVGLHIGVDLIAHRQKYYIVELNTGAAIRPERRKIYNSRLDPIVLEIVSTSRHLGFRKLVVMGPSWGEDYREEFRSAGEDHKVEVIPASYPWMEVDTKYHRFSFPNVLENETLYVSFGYRYTPIDYYIHDKQCSQSWLADALQKESDLQRHIGLPHTCDHIIVPPLNNDARWPNLVVKSTGRDSGECVAMARVTNEEEARRVFGIDGPNDFPSVLRGSIFERLIERLFRWDNVIYQSFIPPRIDGQGHAEILRLHLLLTPLDSRLLSAHRVVSDHSIPDRSLDGLAKNPKAYIVNFSQGAHYELLDEDTEEEVRSVAKALCKIIDIGLTNKFHCRD